MEDGDSDAEMADYGTDFSDDVDRVGPTQTSLALMNRESDPPFPFSSWGGDFPIPDSRDARLAGNRGPGGITPEISWSGSESHWQWCTNRRQPCACR
jgi:hypothetical protein